MTQMKRESFFIIFLFWHAEEGLAYDVCRHAVDL